MSHFSVLVVTNEKPTMDVLSETLAPYHEFECTGKDDEYVEDVDITPEAKAVFEDTDTEEIFSEWASHYYGYPIIDGERPGEEDDDDDDATFGWVGVDGDGNVCVIQRTNPNAKWDWWVVGGRWSGFLKPKPGSKFEKGIPGLMGSQSDPRGADIIRKGDVDIEGMREMARKSSSEDWTEVRKIIGPYIEGFMTWDEVMKKYETVDKARDAYHAQPLKKAIQEAAKINKDLIWIDADSYIVDHDQFVEDAVERSISFFAIVKDGRWIERGKMGWWGVVSNRNENWVENFNSVFDSIPDDAWLTVVDCHI